MQSYGERVAGGNIEGINKTKKNYCADNIQTIATSSSLSFGASFESPSPMNASSSLSKSSAVLGAGLALGPFAGACFCLPFSLALLTGPTLPPPLTLAPLRGILVDAISSENVKTHFDVSPSANRSAKGFLSIRLRSVLEETRPPPALGPADGAESILMLMASPS